MHTAFKSYLEKLGLGAISRKLYLSDIKHFLAFVALEPTLDLVSNPKIYSSYISTLKSQAVAPSVLKRSLSSLRQFGNFLNFTYGIINPTLHLSFSDNPRTSFSRSTACEEYIKVFTNQLKSRRLSTSTVKSYKSDVARYLDWTVATLASTKLSEVLKPKNIKKYLNHLSLAQGTQSSTIDRKMKALTKFSIVMSSQVTKDSLSDNKQISSFSPEQTNKAKSNSPLLTSPKPPRPPKSPLPEIFKKSVKKINYRNILPKAWNPNLRNALSMITLLVFITTLAIFGYRQFSSDVRLTAAYPSTPVTPNRQLSFQGRLEDPSGTPITTATNFVFKLFDDATAGTELYSTGTCSITPDSDGVFNTQIGSTCGAGIASSVFSENSDVWLEVTVGAEVLDPRQQIATVAYALNSETIQGFPISSTVSAIRNTVIPMNQWGEIIVGEQSPRLTGVSGTFQISAPSLSLTTTAGSNGDISLNPDGTGEINLLANTDITGNLTTDGQVTLGDGGETITLNGSSLILTGFNCSTFTNGGALTTDGSGVVSCSNDDGGGGGGSFTDLTSGTNTTAAMVVGTGASLNFSGSGTINASTLLSGTWASPGSIGSTTPNTGAFTTLSASSTFTLPNSNTLTGVAGYTQFSNGISIGGATTYYFNSSGVINASAATIGGNLNLTAPSNLIFGGTTHLGETTSAVDSGAYLIGAFDEFDNSNSLNVQAVLNDLDSALTTALTGASLWTDAGTYLYPTSAETLGNSAIGGANKIAGLYLADSAPLAFGTDNDLTFSFAGATLGSVLTPGSMIGINTTTALATLDVRSSLGTIPVASISGDTSMAALIVDQSGSGDIFTASSAGQPRFVVKNNGNVGIDVSDPTSKLSIGGSSSSISNASGDITIDAASDNISFSADSLIDILNIYAAGELGLGLSDAVAKLDVHGAMTGKALVMFNEIGDQDILTASASGSTVFRLRNDGSLSLDGDYLNFGLTEGSSGYGIRNNAGTIEFKTLSGSWTPIGGSAASWWDQTSGTIQPYNKTVDLLLGGDATASARIALININSGTPTATLSAGTSGGLYINASGAIATTAKQTLALGDATTTGNIILQGGNVGIGVASPTKKLEVNGYVVAQRFVDTASSTFYIDPASTGTSIIVAGDIISDGAFSLTSNATNGNITINAGSGTVLIGASGAGKLDAGTIDPPYTINGEKFATYMAGMTGVKEETTGTVMASEYLAGAGYRATLDFANALTGSDLWIFAKTSNLKENLDKMVVLLSSAGSGRTWYEIDPRGGKLHLYSSTPTMISYRLTAPRFDYETWSNIRDADSTSIGHVINDAGGWSVSDTLANFITQSQNQISTLFGNVETNLISPLSTDLPITIASPVLIPENQTSDSPELIVEGEIQTDIISARVAQLEEIHAETIIARNIIADTIEANQIIGLDAKIATFSSGLSDTEISSLTERIKARLSLLSGNSPSAEDIPTPPSTESEPINYDLTASLATSSALLSSLEADFAVINNYLAVIGQATITTLDVTDNLYASSIQSKDLELAIQPLGGRINLASNTLIVDSSGQVAINGDLLVSGQILADSASFNSLEIGTQKDATSSALGNLLSIYNEAGEAVATIDASGAANLASLTTGMITITGTQSATDSSALSTLLGNNSSNSTAGISKIVSPGTEVTINSPYITENSLIYLTPTGDTSNKVLFVKSKQVCSNNSPNPSPSEASCVGGFTVAIDSPALSDISFNWWIIELAPPTEDQQL